METATVYVVPVFTSAGYFTDLVLPREMGLEGRLTERSGRRVLYCAPVGTHPGMAGIVLERADEVAASAAVVTFGGGEPTLVIVGHGTDRHADSGSATRALVERVRALRPHQEVHVAFLDQSPMLAEVLDDQRASDVIVVPFFIAEGWHVGTSIPEDLGLGAAEGEPASESANAVGPRTGRPRVRYAKPVGTHPGVTTLVQDMVREAIEQVNLTGAEPSVDRPPGYSPPTPLPAARARRAFLDWVREGAGRPRVFLQTVVWHDSGGFEVRHMNDVGARVESLDSHTDPADALALARLTEDGRYRALKTAPDLRRGWRFSGLGGDEVWEVYEHLYPAAPVHRFLGERGELRVVSFRESAARQTGMYAGLNALPDEELERLVESRCGAQGCLRDPTWAAAAGGDEAAASGAGPVPCPEPCSVFLSEARAALRSGS